jgi:hypothetical protein
MLKSRILAQAVALAVMLPGVAVAEFEISGAAKIEYSIYSSDGQPTGASQPTKTGDAMKVEPSLKLFINSDVGEESAFHAELLLADDGEAPDGRLEGGESYTQYEVLREFYFDVPAAGWDFRLGKQQVVWGTADGIKLLDVINPTDFRELNQNVFEDARIPVWMINAEKYFDDGSNIQLIVSEAQPNVIAGLDPSGEAGAPFIFKGVDSITGKQNGFLNVASALSKVANSFGLAAAGGFFDMDNDNQAATVAGPDPDDTQAGINPFGLNGFTGLTVFGFAGNFNPVNNAFGPTRPGQFITDPAAYVTNTGGQPAGAVDGGQFLAGIANDPATNSGGQLPATNGNNGVTNLIDSTSAATFLPGSANSAFEFMPNATFATFNTFAGTQANAGFRTVYEEYDETEGNLAFRYKNSTDSGVNYSFNYLYHMDSNPSVNMQWRDSGTGEVLTVQRVTADPTTRLPDTSTNVSEANVPNSADTASVSVLLHNAAGEYYGMAPLTPAQGTPFPIPTVAMAANRPELVFVETLERVNSLGASFDMAIDSLGIPTVLRGEFLLSSDVHVPVVDRRLLAIGDLANALKTQPTDFFKYVLGIDFTVLTNMLFSTQLIQMYNLDFVEENRTCTTQNFQPIGGNPAASFDCSKYTADPSTIHMSNGLQKGDEVESFVSVFFSKPFGSDVQHRWNNILIFENGGGYWNRFDVEYSINNDLIGLVEVNSYWGDEDTMFGQFKDSSNLQLGLKYLF